MAEITIDLRRSIDSLIASLRKIIPVEKVFFAGGQAHGLPPQYDEVRLVVISSAFEGQGEPKRIETLARVSRDSDGLIEAWGYTPAELQAIRSGENGIPLLSMLLHNSTQIFGDD